ncbi:MAG: glycosyltransferase family 4 protein [Rhizobiaceae bacterium]
MALGGTETSVVQLAEAFAARGHEVTVLTRTDEHVTHKGVEWNSLASARGYRGIDLFLPVQHPRLFHLVRKPRRLAVWLIWPVNNVRHYKRIPVMWWYRPTPVVASRWQESEYSWVLPPQHPPIVIPLAVEETWRNHPPLAAPPPPTAIYASMAVRGLPWLLPVWDRLILPQMPEAKLRILGIKRFSTEYSQDVPDIPWVNGMSDAGRASLEVMPTLKREEQREVMRTARVMLYHGHRSEAFCLAAAEAQALGVPTIVGPNAVLPERVRDGVTGFVRKSEEDFAEAALRLLRDDQLWRSQHEASLRLQQGLSWDEVAAEFERQVLPR